MRNIRRHLRQGNYSYKQKSHYSGARQVYRRNPQDSKIRSEGWDGTYILVDAETNYRVEKGTIVKSFRDEDYQLDGGRAPHKVSSSGKIWVTPVEGSGQEEYYPSVFSLKWLRVNPRSKWKKRSRYARRLNPIKYCNCAGCGNLLINKDAPFSTAGERVRGKIHGRPYCSSCLDEGSGRFPKQRRVKHLSRGRGWRYNPAVPIDLDPTRLIAFKRRHNIDPTRLTAFKRRRNIDPTRLTAFKKRHNVDPTRLTAFRRNPYRRNPDPDGKPWGPQLYNPLMDNNRKFKNEGHYKKMISKLRRNPW